MEATVVLSFQAEPDHDQWSRLGGNSLLSPLLLAYPARQFGENLGDSADK